MQKRKDCEKLTTDHKMDSIQFQELNRRTDVVSYALMAEINHFHKECANDFKKAMRSFLIEQIAFYERVVNKMKEALTAFDE
ncbi:hypothetical protein J437_LFUL015172 [Ladona fulva]|uniref:Sorting nexin protein WASP-binding domain-containing protein n=1 Tax=Ladona fulva TaxID=123851 RepID=A0A8K0P3S1_LADFU|nr:hypothetical protein J437_LFUL015172 [Ladona fulva]